VVPFRLKLIMAIHILYGPGGTGKSYWQIRRIVEELRFTPRNIVTNLAVDVPRLAQFVEESFPGLSCDVVRRVRVLDEVETRSFWEHRGPLVPSGESGELVPDKGQQGVLYVIDEAGAAGFDATGWASSDGRSSRGLRAAWYLDQQRKFGDDVFASQNGRRPQGIAKPFRDKAHYFIKLKNGYLATFGVFKGRGRFTAEWFTHEPEKGSEPCRVEHWEMDESGLASCYKTEKGVGVVGSGADKGKRAKGIPILWAIPGAILLAAVVMIGAPALLSSLAFKKTSSAVPSSSEVTKEKATDKKANETHFQKQTSGDSSSVSVEPVRVRGYVMRNGKINVVLSDGRVLTERDVELGAVDRNGAWVSGQKLWFVPPPRIQQHVERVTDPPGIEKADTSPLSQYVGESLFPASDSVLRMGIAENKNTPQVHRKK